MLINDKIYQLGQRLIEVALIRLVDKLGEGITTTNKPKDPEREDNENEQRLIEEWL